MESTVSFAPSRPAGFINFSAAGRRRASFSRARVGQPVFSWGGVSIPAAQSRKHVSHQEHHKKMNTQYAMYVWNVALSCDVTNTTSVGNEVVLAGSSFAKAHHHSCKATPSIIQFLFVCCCCNIMGYIKIDTVIIL